MRNLWLQIKNFLGNFWKGLSNLRSLRKHKVPPILENFSKNEVYVLIATLLVAILTGGFLIIQISQDHGSGPHYGGSLTEGLIGQPQFINPVLSLANDSDASLSRIIYAQLFKFDPNGNLIPDLSSQLPQVSSDGKTYTLKLRPNLKWQDGKPMTADDVIFTIQTIQNSQFESPLRPNWTRVKVDKVDDLTLNFGLREVDAGFMTNFALGIIPKHIWGNLTPQNFRLADANLKPVSSGPYSVSEIKKTSDGNIKSIMLIPNRNYYLGPPFITNLTFRFYPDYDSLINAYLGKEIQSIGYVPFNKKSFTLGNDRVNQYTASLPQYQAVFFNLQKTPIMQDKAVRQALSLATDRGQIINKVYDGQASPDFGPILPGNLGYDESLEKKAQPDISQASEILDKAGWVLDPATNLRTKTYKSGKTQTQKTLEFNLALSSDAELNVQTAQILQSQWSRIGAKINLTVVSPSDLESKYIRPRNFDALLFAENIGADPDPFSFWASSQSHDPGLNLSGFANAQADKLLTAARQTSDNSVRANNYRQFQGIINDQLPAIFLIRSSYIYISPKKIQNVNLQTLVQPADRFTDINRWYFER